MRKWIFLLLGVAIFLAGCAEKKKDPFAEYRNTPENKLFVDSEKALKKGHYSDATKSFAAYDAIYPFGPHARQSQLDIIYAYYKNEDDDEALAAADRYIHLYPSGPYVDYAYYMRGIVGFDVGLTWAQKKLGSDPALRDIGTLEQSFGAFATLEAEFPKSEYTPDALNRMAYIRNLMARREMDIADFYANREAYEATVNRASEVVLHYQGTPQVIHALAVLVKTYTLLGLDKDAKDAYRVLLLNYPDAVETQRLSGIAV